MYQNLRRNFQVYYNFDLGNRKSTFLWTNYEQVLVINQLSKVFERLPLSKTICIICLIENPLKMTKNVFYSILKTLFILKVFDFLSRHFGYVRKTTWLER